MTEKVDDAVGGEIREEAEQYVTIGQYPEPMEAEMAKLRLESAGIEPFLSGENAAIMAPGLGPLHLRVAVQDEADARAILADPGDASPVDTESLD